MKFVAVHFAVSRMDEIMLHLNLFSSGSMKLCSRLAAQVVLSRMDEVM
jgi:hypothetical protein